MTEMFTYSIHATHHNATISPFLGRGLCHTNLMADILHIQPKGLSDTKSAWEAHKADLPSNPLTTPFTDIRPLFNKTFSGRLPIYWQKSKVVAPAQEINYTAILIALILCLLMLYAAFTWLIPANQPLAPIDKDPLARIILDLWTA